jgi:hypothetical protein
MPVYLCSQPPEHPTVLESCGVHHNHSLYLPQDQPHHHQHCLQPGQGEGAKLAHLKTKHGRLLVGDLQPRALINTIIWVLKYACVGPSMRLLYPHLPGRAQAGEGLHHLHLGPAGVYGRGGQGQGEGGRHQPPHGGGQDTPQLHRLGADQLVRKCSLLYIYLFCSF